MNVFIFLLALIPVLFIGVMLIEMLLASAPRRGKWPFPPVSKRLRTARALPRLPIPASQATATVAQPQPSGAAVAHGSPKPEKRIKILTPGGYLLEGTSEQLVTRLSRMGEDERSLLTGEWQSDPEGFLRRLEAEGVLLVQVEE